MTEQTNRPARPYTSKQMGDACEMLIAAELTLAGIPAMKAPDYWPGYDAIAQPSGMPPQRISVKARTFKRGSAFVTYHRDDVFDWLAIVLLPGDGQAARRMYLVPRASADAEARSYATERMDGVREFRIDEVDRKFGAFVNNFALRLDVTERSPTPDPVTPFVRLPVDWFTEVPVEGVDPTLPGLYQWTILEVGVYVGQYTDASRPRTHYTRNVANILNERPYRKGKPDDFRTIHRALADAVRLGAPVELRLIENVIEKSARNRRENEIVAAHRLRASTVGGLPVLNASSGVLLNATSA